MDLAILPGNDPLDEQGQEAFDRLLRHGFALSKNAQSELSFSRGNVTVSIWVDPYAHEIEAYFHNTLRDTTLRLYDALSLCPPSSFIGMYQFPSAAKLPKGLAAILNSILFVIESCDDLETFLCQAASLSDE